MRQRFLVLMAAVAATVMVALVPILAAGQAQTLRTSWGDPDLQGVWTGMTPTPLERPLDKGKIKELEETTGTFEEAERIAHERSRQNASAEQRAKELAVGNSGNYNVGWQDSGRPLTGRTSLSVDPPDGRLPLTPKALADNQQRSNEEPDAAAGPGGKGKADGPEDRDLGERCLHWERLITGGTGTQHYRIAQSPGFVAINMERLHDNRVIPLDGRPHLPRDVRLWNGDSRGRWEGATLVVDTTNFINAKQDRLHTNGDLLHVIERFTRVDANTINYEATLEDPTTWTKPWTLALPLWKEPEGTVGIFEYACHEGNTIAGGGMLGMLRGARADERAEAKKGKRDSN